MFESFFATFEPELLTHSRFISQIEARMVCFTHIERSYNRCACTQPSVTLRLSPSSSLPSAAAHRTVPHKKQL